ncbi:MAG: hypothetical protein P8013_09940 [Candidatus Sulfobium sp.]|jgi:hypothetical protein
MSWRNIVSRVQDSVPQRAAVVSLAFVCLIAWAASADAAGLTRTLGGIVKGAGGAQTGYDVSLYAAFPGGPFNELLGNDTTDGGGSFEIKYRPLPEGHTKPVLYVLAEKGKAMLAGAVGGLSKHDHVVVNELTTVAMGTAFAQFIDGRDISGNTYGMLNAVGMAANMANPKTGAIGEVLDNGPNGSETSTRKTFYSMANILAACVDNPVNCDDLFDYATPIGGPAPATVLQALANMTRYPSGRTISNADGLFGLSLEDQVYGPALSSNPSSWLLFIKFTGVIGDRAGQYSSDNLFSGPGQIGFDERGFAWINDNYTPSDFDPRNPLDLIGDPTMEQIGCAGLRLLKFYPSGKPFPGVPYFGGGLSGAGFGIALDPRGKVWVGNFGFESPLCTVPPFPPDSEKIPATHDSISLFLPNGTPISVPDGFTNGHIWWPQGMAADKAGDIWVGNCGNDTVTLIPRGIPSQARNFPLPGGLVDKGGPYDPPMLMYRFSTPRPLIKPFGLALDPKGRAWVVGNAIGFKQSTTPTIYYTGGLYRISKDGSIVTIALPGDQLLTFPMGIAGDSRGNMWVTNSDHVSVPCVTPFSTDQGGGFGPSLVYFPADSSDASGARVFGTEPDNTGGLTIPWGDFVDGNDTVWVFNFGVDPNDSSSHTTPLSQFCGAGKCPAGLKLGDAISPPTGYLSDALDRVTGGGVDPSGNIWILNNWKKLAPLKVGGDNPPPYPSDYPVFERNPGGNSFVIVPGAAAPIKTPLLGPPESFDNSKHPSPGSR